MQVTPESTPTPAPTPAPTPVPTLTLAAVGDVTLAWHFEEWIDERIAKDGWSKEKAMTYGFDRVRKYLASADVAFANCENAFTTRGKPYPKKFPLRARPELVGVLVDGSIDVVSLSNNHTWDYGDEGILDTIQTVTDAGIKQAGAGRNGPEARTPAILEANGLTIGFLAYSAVGWYNPNQKPTGKVWDTTKPGIAACVGDFPCLKNKVVEDVTQLAKKVDIPVVSFHWGQESKYEPAPFQQVLAKEAIDHGAKLIIGHHPHVLQGIEVYKEGIILYSLGNFLFGGNWNPKDQDSIIFRATFQRTEDGDAKISSVGIVPVKISNPPDAYFQPFPYDAAHRDRVLRKLERISKKFPETVPQLRDGG